MGDKSWSFPVPRWPRKWTANRCNGQVRTVFTVTHYFKHVIYFSIQVQLMRKFCHFFQLYFLPLISLLGHSREEEICSMIGRRKKKIHICVCIFQMGKRYVSFLENIYPTAQPKYSWQDLQTLLLSQPLDGAADIMGGKHFHCRKSWASLCLRSPDAPSLHLQSTTLLIISYLKPNLYSENLK